MRVLIIEDELLAQAKLESLLVAIDSSIKIAAKLVSVSESIAWLKNNSSPDVAFVDIQLSDSHSFEIFRQVSAKFPVIFTTAFDKYIMESFEFNSIDYILKPVTEEKVRRALSKLKNLEQHFVQENILKLISTPRPNAKDRIVVKKGTDFVTLTIDDIAYFFTEHRIVFAKDFSGHQYIVDRTIGELEESFDRKRFFRINRKYLANIKSIEKFKPDNGKIRVYLKPEMREEIHVSKETAPEFRDWMDGV